MPRGSLWPSCNPLTTQWVAVSPRHRRRGLGKWLVQCVLHHHVEVNELSKVYLRTEDYRDAAIKLYLECGFVMTGVVS